MTKSDLTPSPPSRFERRHIGPSPRDVAAMLETVRAKNMESLIGETLPAAIRQKKPLDLPPALSETEALAHMEAIAAQEPGVHLADRPRLFRHHPAGRHPAQHPGEPGLVHGLHALPARDQPGPAGGAVQLPDHDLRSDRRSTSPTPRCSTRRPRRPKRWRWRSARRRRRAPRSSSIARCTRRRLRCCARAPRRSAGRWSSAIR